MQAQIVQRFDLQARRRYGNLLNHVMHMPNHLAMLMTPFSHNPSFFAHVEPHLERRSYKCLLTDRELPRTPMSTPQCSFTDIHKLSMHHASTFVFDR